jgi:hypothetical protein
LFAERYNAPKHVSGCICTCSDHVEIWIHRPPAGKTTYDLWSLFPEEQGAKAIPQVVHKFELF